MINYFFEDVLEIENIDDTREILEYLLRNENKKLGKISYIFCTDDYLLKINQDYLQHDYYTDVISFDYSKGNRISGDIYISVTRLEDNAKKLSINFDKELKRVVCHGLLHFCGYKDKLEEDAKIMREKEDYYINTN